MDPKIAPPSPNGTEPVGSRLSETDFDPASLAINTPTPPADDGDIYNPANLALSQDFPAVAGVVRKINTIKVQKPSATRAFRVHPDATFCVKTLLLSLKDENEYYLVLPALHDALASEATCNVFTIFACVTKAGTPFLWPVKMADSAGRWNVWNESAWRIAEEAKTHWMRMTADREAGHYTAFQDARPPDQQQKPEWPSLTFTEWLRIGFKNYTICDIDHPILKRLRVED
jgi:hypothetical protein